MRLSVLEMTVATIAARLPRNDFFEIVALLVFVARGADAVRDGGAMPAGAEILEAAATDAANMLARMAQARRADGNPEEARAAPA